MIQAKVLVAHQFLYVNRRDRTKKTPYRYDMALYFYQVILSVYANVTLQMCG